MHPAPDSIGPSALSAVEVKAAKKAAKRAGRRVTWDKFCKCIPLIATVNTIFNMHQKSVYQEKIRKGVEDPKLTDAYHQRIINEPTWQQVALLFPVFGQLVVGIATLAGNSAKSGDKTIEEFLITRSNFDRHVDYEGSYVAENPGTAEEQLKTNSHIDQLEEKINSDTCSPEELYQLVKYAVRDEGRSARSQFLLGKYFAASENAEDITKAQFWLNQAKINHWPMAINFLNDNPELKIN